jgi:hypothetical protein
MALIRADRVKESSTSTGTGAFTLAGADSTYRTFASVCAVADTVYYAIAHRTANEWEVGLGTYSATNTLTRTTVHSSSNANAAVTFSAGTKDVLLALTKTQLETYASLAGSETLTNKTINASNNTITNVSLTSGVTGTLPLANGGTGTTTAQLAINALAGAVTSGSYLRGNGTNVVMATISAGDVPTLNQNTTGTASGSVSGTASYVAKFTSTNVVGNSQLYDNGTNVGIATASPGESFRLDVSGSIRSTGTGYQNATSPTLTLTNSTANTGRAWGINSDNTGLFQIFDITAATATRMVVDSSGKIGVNILTPDAQVHITSAAAATKGLIVRGAAAQSANLQEWLNSAGLAFAAVNPSGSLFLKASSVLASGYGYLDPNATAAGVITLYGGGGEMDFNVTGVFPMTFKTTNTERMRILSGGNVGIGTTSPVAQLHVTTAAAATKGLIVKGAAAQSANLQEWQNSAGTALVSIGSDGVFYVNKDSVYTDYIGQIVLQGATNGNKRLVFGIDTTNNIGFMQSYLNTGGTSYPIILQPNNNGTATVGIGGVTAPDAQLHVASHLAARKGLIVRGASGQTANLTEWQNNSGSVFASIDNNYGASFWGWSGNAPNGGIEQVCLSVGNKSYWSANDAALMIIGYVGLAGVYDGTSWSMYFKTGTSGATTEKMRLTGGGLLGIGTTSPAGQLHTQASAATTKALVVRGASAQSANLQEWQDNAGSTLAAVLSNGAIQPASMADSAAANNTIYYSTTASKLVYKNSAGTVNNLY